MDVTWSHISIYYLLYALDMLDRNKLCGALDVFQAVFYVRPVQALPDSSLTVI